MRTLGITRTVSGAILALLAALPCPASPPGWWDDRPLPLGAAGFQPLAAAVARGGPAGAADAVFIVLRDPDDLGLHLTATFDGGCSFCPPVPFAAPGEPVTAVSLAAGLDPGGGAVLALGFPTASGSEFWAARVATFDCADLPQASGFVRTILDPAGEEVVVGAHPPDDPLQPVHLHAAWLSDDPARGGSIVLYSNDLDGDLAPGGTGEVSALWLTERHERGLLRGRPAVPLDLAADRFGAAAQDTGVRVIFSEQGPVGLAPFGLYTLRSSDSGRTWSADGGPPVFPPADAPLHLAGQAGPAHARLASVPAGPADPAWEAVLLQEGFDLLSDAALRLTGSMTGPDWQEPDPATFGRAGPGTVGMAFALVPDPAAPDSAAAWAFWDEPVDGIREVVGRPGTLDPLLSRRRDFSSGASRQITGVAPARMEGWGSLPVAASGANAAWLFWTDWSDAVEPRPFFKRTDAATTEVSNATATPDPGCPPRVVVRWDLDASPPHCDLRRVRVHHGETSGGPYPDSVEVAPGAGSALVDGLRAAIPHYFLLMVEDEAGNAGPPGMDPAVNSTANAAWEVTATTPACPCAPTARIVWSGGEPCQGDPVNLDGSGSSIEGCGAGMLLEWLRDGVTSGVGPFFSDAPAASATYTLRVSCMSDPACVHAKDLRIEVHPLPLVETGGPYHVCLQAELDPLWSADLSGSAAAVPPARLPGDALLWGAAEGSYSAPQEPTTTLTVQPHAEDTTVAISLHAADNHGCAAEARSAVLFDLDVVPPRVGNTLLGRREGGALHLLWADIAGEIGAYQIIAMAYDPANPPFHTIMEQRGTVAATAASGEQGAAIPIADLPTGLVYLKVRATSDCLGRPGPLL